MPAPSKARLWLAVVVILAVIIAWAFSPQIKATVSGWGDAYFDQLATDVDDDEEHDDDAPREDGIVHIDDEVSDKVGLEVLPSVSSLFSPESRAFVTVVDLAPILELRTQYLNTLMQKKVAEINRRAASEELARLKKVAKVTGSVASKNIVYADFSLQEAEAKKIGLEQSLVSFHEQILNKWGPELASWVEDAESEQWQDILRRKEQLLYVTLPSGTSLPKALDSIRISKEQLELTHDRAVQISASSVISQQPQGTTYLFKTSNRSLHAGMRLDGWIPQTDESLQGIFVPEQAIVWHEGKPWAYVELTDDHYQRRSLENAVKADNGVFETRSIIAGDHLVIKGAQMLLSEEFKWQIMDEDDD
jgi:hypothetical protein